MSEDDYFKWIGIGVLVFTVFIGVLVFTVFIAVTAVLSQYANAEQLHRHKMEELRCGQVEAGG